MKNNLETFVEYVNKVIDLTRRNRLLKFPKKSKSITFKIDLQEFLKRFGSLDELQIEFHHRLILHQNNDQIASIAEESLQGSKDPYIPPTDLEGESLITVLNTLRLEAKRKFEEHGLHTLFLAIGKVKWKEPSVGSRKAGNVINEYDFNAPLLLVPIQIEEKKIPKRTVVSAHLEAGDISYNKVLELLLQKEYRSRQFELSSANEADWLNTYQALCLQVKEIFTESKLEYEIIDEIQIGQYSFFGQQIYSDLNENIDDILQHEFINALCSHAPIKQENLVIDVENPDVLLTPRDDYNVMDADRSQLQVLQNVINGNHLNVQGPPGTGKSQTIVNLISNLLARGKTVLMVCEKQIALEVVLSRLESVGLDKLCLPLFQHNADKKVFAKSVLEDRDSLIKIYEQLPLAGGWDVPLEKRETKIKELRSYAALLGEIVKPLNRALHWVHGQWSKHSEVTSDAKIPWMGNDPLLMTFEQYEKIMYLLDNISPVFDLRLGHKLNYWKNIRRCHFSPDFVNRLNKILADLHCKLSTLSLMNKESIKFDSVEDIHKLILLEKSIDNIQSIHESFIIECNLDNALKKLTAGLNCLERYQMVHHDHLEKYKIPFNWDPGLIGTLDAIDNSIKISAVEQAAVGLPALKDNLEAIIRICDNYPIGDFSINELCLHKDIFLLDPVIQNLKDWDNPVILEQIFDKLAPLNMINNQLNRAKKSLDKWGIIIDDIEPAVGLSISGRFSSNYGNALRYFNSNYWEDCRFLTNLCLVNTPRKYNEFTEIATSIKNIFISEQRVQVLLEAFRSDYVTVDKSIKPHQLSTLSENVDKLLVKINNLERKFLSPKIVQLYNSLNKQLIKDFYLSVEEISLKFNTSWNIFKADNINFNISLNDFIAMYPSLQLSIENKLKLNANVCLIDKSEMHDYSVGQIKQVAREIQELFLILESIKSLNLESLFKNKNIVELMINDKNMLNDFLINIKNLKSVVDQTTKAKSDITLREATTLYFEQQRVLSNMKQFMDDYSRLVLELNRLFENDESINFIEKLSFNDALVVLKGMLEDKQGLEEWMKYVRYFYQLDQLEQAWFFDATKDKVVANPASLFAQALWSAWLESYYAQNPALQNFDLKDHKRIISEFRDLEQLVLKTNAFRIISKHATGINNAKIFSGEQEQMLVRQSQLKMRHQSIRKLVSETGALLLKYKPCWMVSPLTLSSYIPYGSIDFDVVIFDEASQLRVESSLAAISRAKQVIIFGDENQLPPTSFFENATEEDEDEDVIDSYESILHATKEILPGANDLLSHHYRSKYEDLIAFSNHYVYNDRLVTFPNPNKNYKAVQFEFIEKGVFDGGKGGSRRNVIEAKRVVEICFKQITEEPQRSLGVIAFSRAQEIAIRDALLDFLKDKPHLNELLDETSDAPGKFFIKNLESVQGDERDVIILSIGYGKDKKTGEVYNRFGPINSQHGYRRLNVAITRAKEKIICVSSIKSSDIRNAEKSRGAFMLQKYLEYAERGIESLDASLLIQNQLGVTADSPFEEEVERALMLRGCTVHRQIGVSGFKIDLAIVNPKNDQEYILGIECDGATYHSSYSARMNDRIRQEILERLGWKLYRIWSQHWIYNKEEIIEDIIFALNDN